MKCFEKLVKDHITSTLPDTLDPLQFAYRPNRSTDDAIACTLPYSTWRRGIPMSEFCSLTSAQHLTPLVPSSLVIKLETLGLDPALCNWVLDLLTGRSKVVKVR
jgi:hypothetical protein